LACPEHRSLAREAAAKAVVLLRNEPVGDHPLLPLTPAMLRTIAVIGHLADLRNIGDGGSSDVWTPEVITALQGLRAALPEVEVIYDDGTDATRVARVAGAADLAVVVVGYTKADEGEFIGGDLSAGPLGELLPGADDPDLAARFTASVAGNPGMEASAGVPAGGPLSFATGGDRSSLRLRRADEELILAVAEATPRAVVAVVAGSAVIMSAWASNVPAIVQSWYAGMEGGHGLADVLLGHRNAEGRLPFTVPVSEEHLPHFERDAEAITYDRWHGWWKFERDGLVPHFPYGFGLSYTSFERGPFTITVDEHAVEVHGSVTNQGTRAGAEIVQVYAGPAAGDRAPRPRRLMGFARIEVAPGEKADVALSIPRGRFSVRSARGHRWVPAAGPYVVEIGRWVGDPTAHTTSLDL
jgi:beta-glucosidase